MAGSLSLTVVSLALLVISVTAYPDIAGSCNGVFSDAHLPRTVDGDGNFKFHMGPIHTNETHKSISLFIAGTVRPKGLLIKAWDPISGKQMKNSRFQGENWGPLREHFDYYDGCPVPWAAVTHTKHVRQLMPLTFTFAWPKDKEASFAAWLVEHEHAWWEIFTSTAESPAAAAPVHCPASWKSSAPALVAFFPVALLVVSGLLLKMMPNTRINTLLKHTHPLSTLCTPDAGGAFKQPNQPWPRLTSWIRLVTFDAFTATLHISGGEALAAAAFVGCQVGSVWLAWLDIAAQATEVQWSDKQSHHPPKEGVVAPNPLDAPLGRALGRTMQYALSMVMLLPTRKSVWPSLIGISHARCIKYHRIVARSTFLLVLLHFVFMFQIYGPHDIFSTRPSCNGMCNLYGTLSFILMCIVLLFALEPVRRKCYNVFRTSHSLTLGVVLCGCLHSTQLIYFLIPPTLLFVLDYMWRLADWGTASAVRSAEVLGGNVTRLVVHCPKIARALARMEAGGIGAYVYVQSSNISGRNPLAFHPFSVSGLPWVGEDHPTPKQGESEAVEIVEMELLKKLPAAGADEFTLHIKSMGAKTWTGRLLEEVSLGKAVAVTVEGPYCGAWQDLALFSTVVCVAGGIGLTPIAPFLETLTHQERRQHMFPKLKRVLVLWSVQSREHVGWFHDLITQCLRTEGPVEILVRVFVTRGAAPPAGPVPCYQGRVNLQEEIEAAAFEGNQAHPSGGNVAVVVCGPPSLMNDTLHVAHANRCSVCQHTFNL